MKGCAILLSLAGVAAMAQPLTMNITATEDSIIVNDTFGMSNKDVALMNLGYGIDAAASGDYLGAIGYFDAALLFDNSNPDIFYNRGLANFYLDSFQTALTDFNSTLTLDPEDTSALSQRGVTYAQLDNEINALADFNKLLRVNPTSSVGHFNKGILYLQMGLTGEGCEWLKKAESLGYPSAEGVRSTYCE